MRDRKQLLIGAAFALIAFSVALASVFWIAAADSDDGPDISGAGRGAAAIVAGLPQSGESIGERDAPDTVTEYVDLLCPACAIEANNSVPVVLANTVAAGEARIERVIVVGHEPGRPVARGAIAAAAQDKLWEFTQVWFAAYAATGLESSPENARRVAREAGLSMPLYDAAVADGPALDAALAVNLRRAKDDELATTPTQIARSGELVTRHEGIASPEEFIALIARV